MKTTADVPPRVASEYAKAPRAHAASEAVGDGYTKTKAMREARASPSKGQFGLPKSTLSGKMTLAGKRKRM